MKVLEINWLAFLADMEGWALVPSAARGMLVSPYAPSAEQINFELREHHDVLLKANILRRAANGKRLLLNQDAKNFLRVIRALENNKSLESGSQPAFETYLSNYFTYAERNSLAGLTGQWYDDYDGIYTRVSRVQWLEEFVNAKHSEWIKHHVVGSFRESCFDLPEVFAMSQRLVGDCLEDSEPIPFQELPSRYEGCNSGVLDGALMSCFRYLLLYPWLDKNRDAVLGVWPRITRRLNRKPPTPPAAVEATNTFQAPLLIHDMTTLLVSAGAEPFRVKAGDHRLFAKAQKTLDKSISGIPAWVEEGFQLGRAYRVGDALYHVQHLGLVQQMGVPGKDLRIETTKKGLEWLELRAKTRLRRMLDSVREATERLRKSSDFHYDDPSLLASRISLSDQKLFRKVIRAATEQYASLPAGSFVDFNKFSDYHSRCGNPLLKHVEAGGKVQGTLGPRYFYKATSEEVEDSWVALLWNMLRARLLPLGAATVGHSSDGSLCLGLSDAGRYLLGLADDFELEEAAGGEVIVQPNFEVVFLGPRPLAEVEISRFAERRGSHVGLLFKITKSSVMKAAAGGQTAESVFEILGLYCSKDIPNNVKREISGWFGACRRITVRSTVLIRCPDWETAARVLAVSGGKVDRVTDTILELRDGDRRPELVRKLKGMGIFV